MENQSLAEFFSALNATLRTAEQVRKTYDRDLALEFNPLLNFFHVSENKLSQIIAYFLNPDETHGQGALFLDIFLRHFGLEDLDLIGKKVCINCEHPTDAGRRLDVYITFPETGFAIGIENKLWAKGQQNQLTDYNRFLVKMHGMNYKLLYWRPYDYHPEEHSIPAVEREALVASGHYSELNHMDDTSDLIEAWMRACQADRVRNFLRDLYQFIQHEINGEKFMGQNNLTADFILKSEENFQTAGRVHSVMNEVYDKVMTNLEADLNQVASELGLTLETFKMLPRWEKDRKFSFGLANKTTLPVNIAFEWEGTWFKNGYIGFINRDGEHPERKEIFAAKLGKAEATDKWPWYQFWSDYRTFSEASYQDVHSKKFAAAVKKAVAELLARIEGLELPT